MEEAKKKIQDDPNNLWKVFNKKAKGQRKDGMKLKEDGKIIEDEKEIADIFNNFFKEKIDTIKQNIETIPEKDPMEKIHELVAGKAVHFDLRPVSLQETIDALKSLKARKSSGGLSIPKAIAKGAAEVLAVPLHRIINISIRDKVYPKAYKKVKGFPVFKKGSRQDKSCYRMVQKQ